MTLHRVNNVAGNYSDGAKWEQSASTRKSATSIVESSCTRALVCSPGFGDRTGGVRPGNEVVRNEIEPKSGRDPRTRSVGIVGHGAQPGDTPLSTIASRSCLSLMISRSA